MGGWKSRRQQQQQVSDRLVKEQGAAVEVQLCGWHISLRKQQPVNTERSGGKTHPNSRLTLPSFSSVFSSLRCPLIVRVPWSISILMSAGSNPGASA